MLARVVVTRILLIMGAIAWLCAAPVVILGIGFSGGQLLNPMRLIGDIFHGDLYALNRIGAIIFVIFPFLFVNHVLRSGRLRHQDERQ